MDYWWSFLKLAYVDIRNDESFWIILSAIGTASVVIYAILKEIILAHFRRPKLESSYQAESPFITEFNGYYFYHLAIRNFGKSKALSCTAYLDEIQKLNPDGKGYKKIDNYFPMSLNWVREKFGPNYIEPGQTKYIDLFKCNNNGQILLQFDFDGFSDVDHLENGAYKLKVIVYSENAEKLVVWQDVFLTEATVSQAQAEKVLKVVSSAGVRSPGKEVRTVEMKRSCKLFTISAVFLAMLSAAITFTKIENVFPYWRNVEMAIKALQPSSELPEKIILASTPGSGFEQILRVIDKRFIEVLDKKKVRGITRRKDFWPSQNKPVVAADSIFLDLGEIGGKHVYAPVTTFEDFEFKLEADRSLAKT